MQQVEWTSKTFYVKGARQKDYKILFNEMPREGKTIESGSRLISCPWDGKGEWLQIGMSNLFNPNF